MSLEVNELEQKAIPPVKLEKKLDKYEDTIYHDAYMKGRLTASMTLDAKNQHKILSNLIWTIFDDTIEKNKMDTLTGNIKHARSIIESTFKILENLNFNLDVKRAATIIEGYGDIIESKNGK